MITAGLLYAGCGAVSATEGLWIAVTDGDGRLLAHEHTPASDDPEHSVLLAVRLAARLVAGSDLPCGTILTDSMMAVMSIQRRGAALSPLERAQRRSELAREISDLLGVGWVAAWVLRDANLAPAALVAHLREQSTNPTTTEAP